MLINNVGSRESNQQMLHELPCSKIQELLHVQYSVTMFRPHFGEVFLPTTIGFAIWHLMRKQIVRVNEQCKYGSMIGSMLHLQLLKNNSRKYLMTKSRENLFSALTLLVFKERQQTS